jgi:hypothetical protein
MVSSQPCTCPPVNGYNCARVGPLRQVRDRDRDQDPTCDRGRDRDRDRNRDRDRGRDWVQALHLSKGVWFCQVAMETTL